LNTACSKNSTPTPTKIPTHNITKLPAWWVTSNLESSCLILCL